MAKRTTRKASARGSRRLRKGGVDRKRHLTKDQQRCVKRLRRYFDRNGYMRAQPDHSVVPRPHRGYELRFSALGKKEREEIVALLRRIGLVPGKPFAKGPHWRIPVYGKEQVEVLLMWMGV